MLHRDEIWPDEWDMVDLAEGPDYTRVVDPRDKHGE